MISKPIALLILALISVGCNKSGGDDGNSTDPNQNTGIVIPKTSEEGLITVRVTVQTDGILLGVKNAPDGAPMDCFIDDKILNPCHDGALYSSTSIGVGTHLIKVVVHTEKGSFSDTDAFDVGVPHLNTGNTIPTGQKDPLQIVIDDQRYVPGMAMKVSAFFLPKVKYQTTPDCDAKIQCNIGGQNEQWKSCSLDTNDQLKLFAGTTMAYGYQDFGIQAVCGDRVGPELLIQWFGVPDNYQNLEIQDIADNTGRHLFVLYRDLDCTDSALIFQCAQPGASDFSACDSGNLITNPPSGLRVRAVCGNATGPELKI